MPLDRKLDRVLATMLGVKFLMTDGETEVACRIDQQALRYRFGSKSPDDDVKVFNEHRDEIERAASRKFDAGQVEEASDAMVVVSDGDLASPLSKKMGYG